MAEGERRKSGVMLVVGVTPSGQRLATGRATSYELTEGLVFTQTRERGTLRYLGGR